MRKILVAIFATLGFGLSFAYANAASYSFLPNNVNLNIGEEITVNLKINAKDEFLNAGQAIISYPNNILEVVSVNKNSSAFNFWVEEPEVVSEKNAVSFIGGTARGVSGESLQIIQIKFKAKGSGKAVLNISDAVIAASDGQGTNILSTTESATINVSTKVVENSSAPVGADVVEPQAVTRKATVSTKVPLAPVVKVPLYPDNKSWYSKQGEAVVLWDVPDDVSSVAFAIDHNPSTAPSKAEGELSTGKKLGILDEGEWYVHVRFKNNVGWSATSHYRIGLDITAPLQFDATIDPEIGDNPTPKVSFETADSLSGLGAYHIFVDGEKVLEVEAGPIALSPLAPGKHELKVRAFDKAGNSTESNLSFETLPLEKPVVNFYTKTISQSESLYVSGTGVAGASIVYVVRDSKGGEITKGAVNSDKEGKWEFRTNKPFSPGKYSFQVRVVDERGAQSYATDDFNFKTRSLVLFSVGSVEIGWFEIFLVALLVVILIGALLKIRDMSKKGMRDAYSTVIARDILKFGAMFEEEISSMQKIVGSKDRDESARATELSFRLSNLSEIKNKMQKYLGQEVGHLKE